MVTLPRPRHDISDDSSEEMSIPLAPLVDIVFLLLIFFLVATTYRDEEKDLSLVLPRVKATAAGVRKLERVLLNVRADGTVLLGKIPVGRESLYRELVEARRANPDIPVVIRGDRSASHGEMVAVYALCQRARVRNIAIAVEPAAEAKSAGSPSPDRGDGPERE